MWSLFISYCQTNKITKMSNLQGKKEDYILSLDNSCQLTKMDIVEQNLNAIDFGYELCKREYEEKLRWIPIEEKLPEYSTINSKNRVNVKFKNIHGEEEICSAELRQITQHCGENSPLLNVWYPFSSCCPLKNVISWRSFL